MFQVNWEAREICLQRGHAPSNISITTDPPWKVCKHCGMPYQETTQIVELVKPEVPDGQE